MDQYSLDIFNEPTDDSSRATPDIGDRAAAAGGGASDRSHLKRSHPEPGSYYYGQEITSPAPSPGDAFPLGKRPRGRPKGSKNIKKLALDDDDSPFYGAQKSLSVGPSTESSAPSRAAKTEGRSRSLALASVAVDGSVGDPKGKGKAIVHGGDSRTVPNEDFCQVCQGKGRFICCDGCPHSFHLTCLDPPMDESNVPDKDSLWFCKECHLAQGHIPAPRSQSSLFGPLLSQLGEQPPSQFQLPNEVKGYFKGGTYSGISTLAHLAVAPNGAYVDGDRLRPLKADRRGFAEERDFTRLKDAKGLDVLCYKCGGSAAPLEGAGELRAVPQNGHPGVEVSRWRKIISCDYCTLHWHFDCLDPPMTAVPQVTHKWMCPNHVEHVMPKSRIPKQGTVLVDVLGPGEFNNGQIEILPRPEAERVKYEDVVLSNKRYRVPEESIIVDFWSKVLGKPRPVKVTKSSISRAKIFGNRSVSPLTSLGSESENDLEADSDASSALSSVGSTANGNDGHPKYPASFSQLVDASILTPLASTSTASPVATATATPNGTTRKIILRRGPVSTPLKVDSKPPAESPSTPLVVDPSSSVPQAVSGPTVQPSADEDAQLRAIREIVSSTGFSKEKLLQFLQQS